MVHNVRHTGLGTWNTLCLALRELSDPRQLAIRLTIAALIVLSDTSFLLLRDLGNGIMHELDARTPPSDEFINRIHVSLANNGATSRWISRAEIQQLNALPGVQDSTFYQERMRQEFRDGSGQARSTTVVSVPTGSPSLSSIPAVDREHAQVGLIYLSGRPFRAEEADRAGVIVTRQWLADEYWRDGDSEKSHEYPTSITFRLPSLPRVSQELAGWNGQVRIPVVGIVDHPPAVVKERGDGVEQVFLPEGFMARLANWQPHWVFHYPTIDGRPLAEDSELVSSITIASATGEALNETLPGLKESAADPFFPINPILMNGSIILKLDLLNRPDHMVNRSMAQAKLQTCRELLQRVGHQPFISMDTKPSSELASPLGNVPEPEYVRGFIRFRHLDHVLTGADKAKARCPALRYYVRYQQGIETYRIVRFAVDNAAWGLNMAFATAMLFVIGMLAHLHVSGKTREAAVLRLRGESISGVGRLFFVQLAMLVLPACLLSQLLSRLLACVLDPIVAGRLIPSQAQQMNPVFSSLQSSVSAPNNLVVIGVLVWALAVLLLATALAMCVNRRSIAAGLRSN